MSAVGLVNFPSTLFWQCRQIQLRFMYLSKDSLIYNHSIHQRGCHWASFFSLHLFALLFKFLNKFWHCYTAEHYDISQKTIPNSCIIFISLSQLGGRGWGTSLPTNAVSHFHSHTDLIICTFLKHEKHLGSFLPNNKEQLHYIFQFSVLIKVYAVLDTLQKHDQSSALSKYKIF